MAFIQVNGVNLYYEISGEGTETILFSHGLLLNAHLYDAQVAYFSPRYRCIVYEHRNHGRSSDSPHSFDIETLYADAVELIEKLGIAPCHFVGLSMGGFVGMRIAARRPDLLRSCVLLNTSADIEPRAFRFGLLNLIAKIFGLRPVVDTVIELMFGKSFLNDPSKAKLRLAWREHVLNNRRSITQAVRAVLQRQRILEELSQISIPVLIIAGEEDLATPPHESEKIREKIPHALYYCLPHVGHLSTIEAPDIVNKYIETFLEEVRARSRTK
ncbi:MAG: alpha/beta fold hydrolase [Bacteroidia bacterium]|nr:alpha/beta hydrolase [Bacteroidia bacterium]MDW8015285.1 alpha/beta fold hydrolase [Bacteroidia bacterium]